MKGDRKPLPLTARTQNELAALSIALHDWWIAEPTQPTGRELVLQLEAEGIPCGPEDNWQTYRVYRSGVQEWEAPPSTYEAELIFRGVLDASIEDSADAGNYTITEIIAADGDIIVRAEPDLVVTLTVTAIDVIARDSN